MTLAHIEPQGIDYHQPEPLDPTGGRLVAWANGLAAAHKIGTALCSTAFSPKEFKGKPDEAAAAILFGDEIGLTPTQALRSVFVISGTPSMYARTMVAIVLSKGHSVWTKDSSDESVTVCGQRAGSTRVEEVTWTAARARKAGYTANKKYETDPQAMLYARAAATVCRRVAPDALAGISYTVEEMEDETAPPPKTARRARTKVTAEVIEPQPEPEPDFDSPVIEHGSEPDEITDAQIKLLHVLLTECEIGDRDAGLAWLSDETGREVTTSKSLSKAEASACIDSLQQLKEFRAMPEPTLDVE